MIAMRRWSQRAAKTSNKKVSMGRKVKPRATRRTTSLMTSKPRRVKMAMLRETKMKQRRRKAVMNKLPKLPRKTTT